VSENQARGLAFMTLVLANLTLALTDAVGGHGRISDPRRRIYWIITGALLLLLALAVLVPPLAAIFRIAPPSIAHLGIAVATALVCGSWTWVFSRLTRQA
jgi:Ca2+-transporting ATPase